MSLVEMKNFKARHTNDAHLSPIRPIDFFFNTSKIVKLRVNVKRQTSIKQD